MRQDVTLILRLSIAQSDLNPIPNRKNQVGVSLCSMSSARPERVSLSLTMTDESSLLSPLRSCGLQIFQRSLRGGVWTKGPTWVSTTVVVFSEILRKTFLTILTRRNFKDMFFLFPLVIEICLNNYPLCKLCLPLSFWFCAWHKFMDHSDVAEPFHTFWLVSTAKQVLKELIYYHSKSSWTCSMTDHFE